MIYIVCDKTSILFRCNDVQKTCIEYASKHSLVFIDHTRFDVLPDDEYMALNDSEKIIYRVSIAFPSVIILNTYYIIMDFTLSSIPATPVPRFFQ